MYCHPTMFDGMADRLFHNNGDGTFTDVSKQAGIANPAGKGLGVTFCDFDRDGDTDIYVANDTVRNFLYRNNGDGTFVDVAYAPASGSTPTASRRRAWASTARTSTGMAFRNLRHQFLGGAEHALLNRGDGMFEDVTIKAGLGSGFIPLGFGTKTVRRRQRRRPRHLRDQRARHRQRQAVSAHAQLRAEGSALRESRRGKFRDVSAQGGAALQVDRVGRGLAVADFDNDGNLDVVISNLNQRPVLLRNQGVRAGNWITIRAKGKKSNAFGLGATVTVETSEGRQVREINNVASYLSSNDIRLHFGLGAATVIRQIEVVWPSGTHQTLKDVAVNQVLVIEEP